MDERQRLVDDGFRIRRVLRIWHALREIQDALALVVERAVDLQRIRYRQAEAAREVREVFAERQCRGSKDPSAGARAHEPLEATGHVERQQAERVAARGDFD